MCGEWLINGSYIANSAAENSLFLIQSFGSTALNAISVIEPKHDLAEYVQCSLLTLEKCNYTHEVLFRKLGMEVFKEYCNYCELFPRMHSIIYFIGEISY